MLGILPQGSHTPHIDGERPRSHRPAHGPSCDACTSTFPELAGGVAPFALSRTSVCGRLPKEASDDVAAAQTDGAIIAHGLAPP